MTPAVFQILLSLADGEKHGYGILREVEERTQGEFELGPGTLYRSIKRMVKEGRISTCSSPEGAPSDDQRRIYYGLTDRGRQDMGDEARRLSRLLSQAKAKEVLGGAG